MQKNSPLGIKLMTIGSIMLITFATIGILMGANGLFTSRWMNEERPILIHQAGQYDEFGNPVFRQRSWRPFHIITLPLSAFGLALGILCRKNKENSDKAKLLLMLAIINIVILIGWRTVSAPLYFWDTRYNVNSNLRLITLLIISSVVAGTGAYKNMTALNEYNKYHKGD